METPRRPTPDEIAAAEGKTLPNVIAPGLDVLFCGINPGLYTAAVGHHFARPGNRFWKALHGGGFTPRVLSPWEEGELLRYGCGITNVVDRATKSAGPRWLAVLGLGAYRTAFSRPKAAMGPQEEAVGGAGVWILPNPSGLNANYRPDDFARLFRELKDAVERGR